MNIRGGILLLIAMALLTACRFNSFESDHSTLPSTSQSETDSGAGPVPEPEPIPAPAPPPIPLPVGNGNTLKELSESLRPGQWAELNTTGFAPGGTNILTTLANNGSILEYGDEAAWDDVTNCLFVIGSSHHDSVIQKFVRYCEATNSWDELPPSPSTIYHAYSHITIESATGKVYNRPANGTSIDVFDIPTLTWQTPIPMFTNNWTEVSGVGALEFFPERNELVWQNGKSLWTYSLSNKTWTENYPYPYFNALGDYNVFAKYNPVKANMMFGGGGTAGVFVMDAMAAVSHKKDAPCILGPTASVVTVDPINGKYLLLCRSDGGFYEYDSGTDLYTLITSAAPPVENAFEFSIFAAPISKYGVVMFLSGQFDSSKVYIYKSRAN
jgi:hypothetical protein